MVVTTHSIAIALVSVMTAASGTGSTEAVVDSFDVAVYGSTPGGVAAAVAAARWDGHGVEKRERRGGELRVALIANSTHVGGFTAGGHCGCDMYQDWVFGGIAREFWGRVHTHYGTDNPNAGKPACRSANATGGYCKVSCIC